VHAIIGQQLLRAPDVRADAQLPDAEAEAELHEQVLADAWLRQQVSYHASGLR
jgi:hypothetical protein